MGGVEAKDLHVVTVGASLLGHAQRAQIAGLSSSVKVSDEEEWKRFRDDPERMDQLRAFLAQAPQHHSAELNSFLRAVSKRQRRPDQVDVYPVGTQTAAGGVAAECVGKWLSNQGYGVMQGVLPGAYFADGPSHAEQAERLGEGLVKMLEHLIDLAMRNAQNYERIFFNPTGGMKAHVITCALAGFLTGCQVYYMHDEFQDVVFLPPLFYLPNPTERGLLGTLADRKPRVGPEYQSLEQKHGGETLDRLERFGLLVRERDPETDRPYRVQITAKGRRLSEE